MTAALRSFILAGALIVATSCGADDAPSIEIVSVASSELHTGDDARDDLVLRVRYEDADGDLGGGRVVVHDCRDAAFTSTFPIDPIATEAAVTAGVSIRGEIVVTVVDVEVIAPATKRPAVCADAGAAQAAFCVVVEDAAGNPSNGACTGAITYPTED